MCMYIRCISSYLSIYNKYDYIILHTLYIDVYLKYKYLNIVYVSTCYVTFASDNYVYKNKIKELKTVLYLVSFFKHFKYEKYFTLNSDPSNPPILSKLYHLT